jgi:hypothetical protein
MLSVLWVLHCRVSIIPPGYTQKQLAAVQTSSVIDVMTAGGVKGQMDGFYKDSDGRPVAVARVHERVAHLLELANRGKPGKIASLLTHARDLARQYFQTGPAAKDLFAELRKIDSRRVTGHGYAWMTDARGFDPGGSYVFIPDGNQTASTPWRNENEKTSLRCLPDLHAGSGRLHVLVEPRPEQHSRRR